MDFNNDGLDDLIVGERLGFVNYYRGLADGTLTSEGRIQDGSVDLNVGLNSAPFVYDWNEDGILDIIQGNYVTNVWVFLGNASSVEDFNAPISSAGVNLFPGSNPVAGVLNYTVSVDQPSTVNVSLFCIDGRMVSNWTMGTVSGTASDVHDLSSLPAGVYTMVLNAGEEHIVHQLVVVR